MGTVFPDQKAEDCKMYMVFKCRFVSQLYVA